MLIMLVAWFLGIVCFVTWISGVIKKYIARKGMMNDIKTAHGRVTMSHPEGRRTSYYAPAGYSVTSSGETATHYLLQHGSITTGFVVNFMADEPINGFHTVSLHSLNKSQTEPFLTNPCEKRVGTVSYVTDKNGKMYFVDFVPDA